MNDAQGQVEMITVREFREADGTGDWPVLSNGATTFFPTASRAVAARLVTAISQIEGIDDGHTDLDIRRSGVTVRVLTRSVAGYGMSRRDVELVRAISAKARELGLASDPTAVQSVEPIVIGAVDVPRVMPFWEALLSYVRRPDSPDEDLVDPRGIGPGLWFETVAEPGGGRPRMHVAVWVPFDQAQARLDAAIQAGGRLIFDEYAPRWWTLADPEGNEADVATTMQRD